MRTDRLRLLAAGLAAAVAFAGSVTDMEARKIRTKHSIPKTTAKTQDAEDTSAPSAITMASDSIDFCRRVVPAIRFYGFDKTATSGVESFFISNGLDEAISRLEIEITYSDMKGRQLHKRTAGIDCDIPAGETKRTDIKSWDTQKSFYYYRSAKPRRQATPFKVKIRLLSATFGK